MKATAIRALVIFLTVVLICSCSHYNKGLVDMGLSVRWNGCNIGAKSPQEVGHYYAWGEVTPKDSFMFSNSLTDERSITALHLAGIIDARGTLTPEHDAATMTMGDGLRLPTRAEAQELVDNCTWEWKRYKKVWGYCVKSKKNGRRIFLPAAGYHAGDKIFYNGEAGYYWSSTVEGSFMGHAHDLFFAPDDDITTSYSGRYDGFPIRPVAGDQYLP